MTDNPHPQKDFIQLCILDALEGVEHRLILIYHDLNVIPEYEQRADHLDRLRRLNRAIHILARDIKTANGLLPPK